MPHSTSGSTLHQPSVMLGGISPKQFMQTYWQKKPLLIRGAFPGLKSPVSFTQLKRLSQRDDVESRLIWREQNQWCMEQGPFDHLPAATQREWTLLVQGVDLHNDAASALLHQFNFVPNARLDDLMISYATEGGGVGPHFDSYDVFLIQAHGQRRWRYGQQKDLTLEPDLPLKILSRFKPKHDVVLEPGDMLYLPPHLAHDGVALGDCMTLSVGFRAPDAASLAMGLLEVASDHIAARNGLGQSAYATPPLPGPDLSKRFKDPHQKAVTESARMPALLIQACCKAVSQIKFDQALAQRYLGCWLTEPHPLAVFKANKPRSKPTDQPNPTAQCAHAGWRLDRRTRMMYHGQDLYINGERCTAKAWSVFKTLANQRWLDVTTWHQSKHRDEALEYLDQWHQAGWIHWQG